MVRRKKYGSAGEVTPEQLSDISSLGSLGLNLVDAGIAQTGFGKDQTYGDIKKEGFNLKGTEVGLKIGANPLLATATGGVSIAVGAGLGLAYDFIMKNRNDRKFERAVTKKALGNAIQSNAAYNAMNNTTGYTARKGGVVKLRKGGEPTEDKPKEDAPKGMIWDEEMQLYVNSAPFVVTEKALYDWQKTNQSPVHKLSNDVDANKIQEYAATAKEKYYNRTKTKNPACLGESCEMVDTYLAKTYGLSATQKIKNRLYPKIASNENIDSRDINAAGSGTSWHFYGALKEDGGNVIYETLNGDKGTKGTELAKDKNLMSKIQIGSFVAMGDKNNNKPSSVPEADFKNSYNQQQGLAPARHTGVIVGFEKDGIPLVYSLGKTYRLDDKSGFEHDYVINHIIAPKEYAEKNITNENYLEKRKDKDIYATKTDFISPEHGETKAERKMSDTLMKYKAEIIKKTGITDEKFNELASTLFSISEQETKGGGGTTASKARMLVTDKLGDAARVLGIRKNPSLGPLQIKTEVAKDNENFLKSIGYNKDAVSSLENPETNILVGMAHAIKLDKNKDKLFREGLEKRLPKLSDKKTTDTAPTISVIDDVSLNPATPNNDITNMDMPNVAKLAYLWNKPGTVKKGKAGSAETKDTDGVGSTYAQKVRDYMKTQKIVFHKKGGNPKGETEIEVEANEIGILKNKKSYDVVFDSDENTPSHEEGGQNITVPNGTQIFNVQLKSDVIKALQQNRPDIIDQHLIPARDHILLAAKALGDEYAEGEPSDENLMKKGGKIKIKDTMKYRVPTIVIGKSYTPSLKEMRVRFPVIRMSAGGVVGSPIEQRKGSKIVKYRKSYSSSHIPSYENGGEVPGDELMKQILETQRLNNQVQLGKLPLAKLGDIKLNPKKENQMLDLTKMFDDLNYKQPQQELVLPVLPGPISRKPKTNLNTFKEDLAAEIETDKAGINDRIVSSDNEPSFLSKAKNVISGIDLPKVKERKTAQAKAYDKAALYNLGATINNLAQQPVDLPAFKRVQLQRIGLNTSPIQTQKANIDMAANRAIAALKASGMDNSTIAAATANIVDQQQQQLNQLADAELQAITNNANQNAQIANQEEGANTEIENRYSVAKTQSDLDQAQNKAAMVSATMNEAVKDELAAGLMEDMYDQKKKQQAIDIDAIKLKVKEGRFQNNLEMLEENLSKTLSNIRETPIRDDDEDYLEIKNNDAIFVEEKAKADFKALPAEEQQKRLDNIAKSVTLSRRFNAFKNLAKQAKLDYQARHEKEIDELFKKYQE